MIRLITMTVSFVMMTALLRNRVAGQERSLASITQTVQELLDIMDNDAVTHRMNLVKTAAILTGLNTRMNNQQKPLPMPSARNPEPDPELLELKRREIFEALFMKYLTFKSLLDMKLCKTFYTHIKKKKRSATNCNDAMEAISKFYDSFTIGNEVELFPILSEVAYIMRKNDRRLKKLMKESTMTFPITDLIRDWDKIPDAEKKFTEIIAKKLDEEKRRVNDISSSSMSESNEGSGSVQAGDVSDTLNRSFSFRSRGGSFRKRSSEIAPLTVKAIESASAEGAGSVSNVDKLISRLTSSKLGDPDGEIAGVRKEVIPQPNEVDGLVVGEDDDEAKRTDEPETSTLSEEDLGKFTKQASREDDLEMIDSFGRSREYLNSSDWSTYEATSVDEDGIPIREALLMRERYGFDLPGSIGRYDPRLIEMMEEQRKIALRNEAISGLHDLMWEEALSIFGDYLPDVDNFFNDALNRKEAFLTSLHDMIPEGVDEISPYWNYIARQAKILYSTNSAEGESSLKKMREYVLEAESEKRQTVNYEKIQLASMNLLFRSKRYADFTVAF